MNKNIPPTNFPPAPEPIPITHLRRAVEDTTNLVTSLVRQLDSQTSTNSWQADKLRDAGKTIEGLTGQRDGLEKDLKALQEMNERQRLLIVELKTLAKVDDLCAVARDLDAKPSYFRLVYAIGTTFTGNYHRDVVVLARTPEEACAIFTKTNPGCRIYSLHDQGKTPP
jgi:hypothetical protein